MAAHEPASVSPLDDKHVRPKGILKHNSSTDSYHVSPSLDAMDVDASGNRRPSMPRHMTEQELVQQNTEMNRGVRRSSSANTRGSQAGSRRQSSAMDVDDSNPRLKWDEANLFHTEQGRGQTQKIDEPKTPFIHNYNPDKEDEDGVPDYINPEAVDVDELDMAKRGKPARKPSLIEPLDLGEPEDATAMARSNSSEKHVIVSNGTGDHASHGEGEEQDMSAEDRRKHREFEAKRKRHYEVPIGALSRDPEDEDGDDDKTGGVPPLPTS